MQSRHPFFRSPALVVTGLILSVNLLCGFGLFHKKKYEAPITKDTMQPDKVLFDRAISNIEHGNYLTARLTLNTLINTYDTSEYLAKAKLAIADSWFREGDAHGLAQAEIEYKDFILFYPNMEEAAQSQSKVCDIHVKQILEPDRDSSEAQRAEDECRQVLVQFPNSPYAKAAEQKLRNVQEILGDKEFKNGLYYYNKGALPAAQGRFAYLAQQYPLYSGTDQALWFDADTFHKMGDNFENQEADALTRIVRDYPASLHLNDAKARLTAMKRPVPDSDPAAYARMKFNIEHRTKEGLLGRFSSLINGHPDMGAAAKDGAPTMTAVRPGVPVSVPPDTGAANNAGGGTGGGAGTSDIGVGVVSNPTSLDNKTDARISAQREGEHKASVGSSGIASDPSQQHATEAPLPSNRTKKEIDEYKKRMDAAAKAQQKAFNNAQKKAAKSGVKPAATTDGKTDATPTTQTAPASTTPAPTTTPK